MPDNPATRPLFQWIWIALSAVRPKQQCPPALVLAQLRLILAKESSGPRIAVVLILWQQWRDGAGWGGGVGQGAEMR